MNIVRIINTGLGKFGISLTRSPTVSLKDYLRIRGQLNEIKKNVDHRYPVYKKFRSDIGSHEEGSIDGQCSFIAKHIYRIRPHNILDIGSYRHFVLGLLGGYSVTTVDIRPREAITDSETCIVADAKKLSNIDDNFFDVVISMQTLQHPGLGRYGDEIDIEAHLQVFNEWKRVLKPGGYILFSTTINKYERALVFNCHRIFDLKELHQICQGLLLEEEIIVKKNGGMIAHVNDATGKPNSYDFYVSCWRKPLDNIEPA